MLRERDIPYLSDGNKQIHRKRKEKSKIEMRIKREIGKIDAQIMDIELLKLPRTEKKEPLKASLNRLYDERETWNNWLVEESNVQHHQRKFKRRYKKRRLEMVYKMICERIDQIKKEPSPFKKFITKEDTARILNIQEKQVEQIFHRLNLEGVLSQAIHNYPHDNNRNPWDGGGFSGWQSDIYMILETK